MLPANGAHHSCCVLLRASQRAKIPTIASFKQAFSNSGPSMINAEELSISEGENNADVVRQASKLVDEGRWRVCNGGKGLERSFKFKTFKATWDFMNEVAAECKKTKHHPEWSNVYNKTHIRWTTHSPEGLSSRDTSLATFCDEAAQRFNELEISTDECRLKSDGTIDAHGCCAPGKSAA